MPTQRISLGGGSVGGPVVVGEDILSPKGGFLRRRGDLIYAADVYRGFKGIGQHSTGLTFRPPPSVSRFPGGMKYTGVGQEDDGYGSADDGNGFYLRLGRSREDVYYTMSGLFSLTSQQPGAIDKLHFYNDTQLGDDSDRSYPHVGFFCTDPAGQGGMGKGPGQWKITGNAPAPNYDDPPYISVPDSDVSPGDNENKFDEMYFCLSFFHAKAMSQSHYGHFQIGNRVFDLRGLGGGYAKHKTQVGDVPFRNGLNFGMSFDNILPGISGGFILERLEITVGDELA